MKDISTLFSLNNKVAIITGGAGVLGGAMAMGLAGAGARVAILGRTASKTDRQAEMIRAEGGEALSITADVLNREQLEKAREAVLKKWGRIDILLNVAGGNLPGATIAPEQDFFDLSLEDFSRVVELNLHGTVLPTYVFAKPMAEQGEGVIINISSMTAQQPFSRVVGYGAAKAAIDNFTKWLAVEMAAKFGEGIRVNAIAPGVFVGEQNLRLLLNEDNSLTARGQTIISQTPMKRFGEPEELIGATVWLCSPAAAFVTGIIVPVDGGFSAFSGV
ncbi:MAG: SDR family oxidoreductase [Phaeodactylibacter sp.]|nr:SDR family oxidoreductase [Phaeodactylibacter sp.]MCB9052565.1 SDR family oxidoreductase [Lewinellaceae bacterium]